MAERRSLEEPALTTGRLDLPGKPWKLGLALLAFVLVVYGCTLGFPFYLDDYHYLLYNEAIHNHSNLLKIWTSASYYSSAPDNWGYRPLTTFVHSLMWIVGGGATWTFRLEKLVLHATVCLLLIMVWKRLWRFPGFFPERAPVLRLKAFGKDRTWTFTPGLTAIVLGFVFVVHPGNNELLNYISATSTLLSGACYIAAYYLYLVYRERRELKQICGSLALFALSVLAKEEGITLPAVIALTELFATWSARWMSPPKAPEAEYLLKPRAAPPWILAAYAVTAVVMALLLKSMFAPTSDIARGSLPRWHYFMTQWRAYLHYISLMFWPWSFNADNLEFGFSHSFWDAKVLSAFAGNALLIGTAWLLRRRAPVLLFSLLWFYLAVAPASSVIVLGEPVNDHRFYHAYFGLIGAALPWVLKGIEWLGRSTGKTGALAGGWIAVAAFLALLVGTEVRNSVWRSPEALWSDTVAKNPSSGRALNNLALAYLEREDWTKTIEYLNRCEKIDSYPMCLVNYGIALKNLGRDAEAEQKFLQNIILDPRRTVGRTFYAGFLENRGRYRDALKYYLEVDSLSSGTDLLAKIGQARIHRTLGHTTEAKKVLNEARSRFGNHPAIQSLSESLGGSS